MYRLFQLALLALSAGIVTGCQKEFNVEKTPVAAAKVMSVAPELKASCTRVELHAGNAKNIAVRFSWPVFPGNGLNQVYTIEADIAGAQFSDPVEIGSTGKPSIDLTVADLNQGLRKISVPEFLSRFEFRIRMNAGAAAPVYSQGAAIDISTYDLWKEYPLESTFRVPGNYEYWDFTTAPIAVSVKDDGEYESYIDMNITGMDVSNPMFFLIKGYPNITLGNMFYDLGNGKFGPGKYAFQVPAGGIYKLNFSTNTNKWSCTNISVFSLYGSAAGNTDLPMEYSNATKTWSLTVNLNPGDFYFRANRSDKIKLGMDSDHTPGSLQPGGDNISVKQAGRYKITLALLSSGNYRYGLQKMF